MSLNLNPDAFAAARDPRKAVSANDIAVRKAGAVANRIEAPAEDMTSNRAGFADLLRASQKRADQTEARRADQDGDQGSAPSAPQAQQTTTETTSTQVTKTDADKPADTVQETPVSETKPEPLEAAAPEPVVTQDAQATVSGAKTALTAEQALAALQAAQTAATTSITEPKPAATPEAQSEALTQALDSLKSALKALVTDNEASKASSETEADKPVDAPLTDAQLTGLMQALLSGKPLTPELKTLSETPKVAEALKAVGNALAALDKNNTKLGQPAEAAPEAALALVTDAEAPQLEAPDPTKTPDASLGSRPAVTAPALKSELQAPLTQIASEMLLSADGASKAAVAETVAAQTAPVDLAKAAKTAPALADFKPAPVDNNAQTPTLAPETVAPESAKAAEALQLTRSESALGSALSTTALNNLTQMSAQIARHMTAKSTQFNMELHPADMGRVDVKLSIHHDGTLSAALSFDSPVAESQFRAQADELRRQLEAQGFQLGEGSLSFSARQNSDQANQGQSAPNSAPDQMDEAPDVARATQAFGALDQSMNRPEPARRLAQKLGLDLLGAQTYHLSLSVTA